MRYVLLSSTFIAASVTLPFVEMPERAAAEPPAPIRTVALAPEATVDPAAAAMAEAPALPDMLELPGPSLGVASLLPTRIISNFFTPDAAEPEMPAEATPNPEVAALPQSDAADPAAGIDGVIPPVARADGFEVASLSPTLPDADAARGDAAALSPAQPSEALDAPLPTLSAATPETAPAAEASTADGDVIAWLADDGADPLAPSDADFAGERLGAVDDGGGGLILSEPAADEPLTVSAAAPGPVADAAEDSDADMVRVTASYLNLRAGPSRGNDIVAGLTRGAEAEVIETGRNGWMRVRAVETGATGWAYGRYLDPVGDA